VVDETHRLEGVLLSQLERGVLASPFRRGAATDRQRTRRAPRAATGGHPDAAGAAPLFDDARRTRSAPTRGAGRTGDAQTARRSRVLRRGERRGRGTPLYGTRERLPSARELMAPTSSRSKCAVRLRVLFPQPAGGLPAATDPRPRGSAPPRIWPRAGAGRRLWAQSERSRDLAEAARRDWVYWRTAGSRGGSCTERRSSVGDAARRL